MLNVMSENMKLKYLSAYEKKGDFDFNQIEADSKDRWRRIIYYLLNIPIQGASQNEEEYFKSTHGPLL